MAPWPRRRVENQRDDQWQRLAAELELESSAELTERMREHLGLGSGAIAPVFSLSRPDQPHVILFDQARERSGPLGSVKSLRTGILLRSVKDHVPVSWRAAARRNRVLESLEASRTGGLRVEMASDEAFDGAVSVYARDVEATRSLLTASVRLALARLLVPGAAANDGREEIADTVGPPARFPSIVVGTRNMLFLIEPHEPLAVARLLPLTADMLTLHAALTSAVKARGEP